jgi:hypothetical protein
MTVEGAAQSLRSSLRGGTTKQSSLAAGVAFAQVAQTPAPAFSSGGVAAALDCFVPRNDGESVPLPPPAVTAPLPSLRASAKQSSGYARLTLPEEGKYSVQALLQMHLPRELDCFVPRNDERGGGAPPSIVTVRLPLL